MMTIMQNNLMPWQCVRSNAMALPVLMRRHCKGNASVTVSVCKTLSSQEGDMSRTCTMLILGTGAKDLL